MTLLTSVSTPNWKYIATVAATAVLAPGLYGCGGGGGTPVVVGPEPVAHPPVMPSDESLALPSGHGLSAGEIRLAPGGTAERGNVVVSCPAGGPACVVTVAADGTASYDRTGGMPGVEAREPHPLVGKWAGDWPGGARTVITIGSVSADGQVTGTYRHQERGGQPLVLEISPDGPVTASIQEGVLGFSYGRSTFEFAQTTEDTLSFTFQSGPDVRMVSVDLDRQDADGMIASAVPSAKALANVIDLVANDRRHDALGNYVQALARTGGGAGRTSVSGTYRGGQYVTALLSHDDDGHLQHNVSVVQLNALQEADPFTRAGRYINTHEPPEELEGVTRSISRLSDHDLVSEGWQVTELNADYDNAGNLSILVATDVQPEDGSKNPYEGFKTEPDNNIELPGAPALPGNQDFLVARIPNGGTVHGTLGGRAGTFSCANSDGCIFVDDHTPRDYYAADAGITFTPDGGTARPVTPSTPKSVPSADYLAFGYWLYVPEDVTDSVNYEFGVYASGGDAFEISHLAAVTGTATYLGNAVGMYYVDGLSSSPTVGSFTADVILKADFGDRSETGFIDGEVNNFAFEDDVASSLPATVTLASTTYDHVARSFGVSPGSTNIYDTARGDQPLLPGGNIGGVTEANVDGEDWYGQWHGAFYGNGSATTDIPPFYVEQPSSVAGVFNTSTGNDSNRQDSGLTGSFAAHRYEVGRHDD